MEWLSASTPLQALPAVEYSSNPREWQPALMVPDLVLLTLIFFYISVTTFDIVKVWRVERKATMVTKEDMWVPAIVLSRLPVMPNRGD
jgi:hypothetical protein